MPWGIFHGFDIWIGQWVLVNCSMNLGTEPRICFNYVPMRFGQWTKWIGQWFFPCQCLSSFALCFVKWYCNPITNRAASWSTKLQRTLRLTDFGVQDNVQECMLQLINVSQSSRRCCIKASKKEAFCSGVVTPSHDQQAGRIPTRRSRDVWGTAAPMR